MVTSKNQNTLRNQGVFSRQKAESLSSIIKNYTESLKDSTHSHLFPQGEERLLKLLREVTHDEEVFMEKLAKECAGLRTADWNAEKISIFFSYLKNAVETINKYNQEDASGFAEEAVANGYQLSFFTNDGVSKTKSFEKLPQTQKGNLLYAEIETALGEMGDAITVGEKRQILMSHLEKLC